VEDVLDVGGRGEVDCARRRRSLTTAGAKDDHGTEAAAERAKHDAGASKQYQIKATGAIIK
jgi:hypothetical protein